MRNIVDIVDIVDKINKYFDEHDGDAKFAEMMKSVNDLNLIIDDIEKMANDIPTEYYRNIILNSVNGTRLQISTMLDAVQSIYHTVNK